MNQNQHFQDKEELASTILRDIPVALGIARPHGTRAPFEWLTSYCDDVYSPPIDRLIGAWRTAEPAVQDVTRDALALAIERATTSWLGAERSLAMLDWAHEIAPEIAPASGWIALLFHRNPADSAETAYWIEQLVERLKRWRLNLHALLPYAERVPEVEWEQLVLRTSERNRVDVAVWLLELLCPCIDKCHVIWNAVVKAWKSNLPELPEGYEDWYDDILDPLIEATKYPDFALAECEDSKANRRRVLSRYAADVDEEWLLVA